MFLITSVITPSKNPLSYHSTRSVFSPEQRLAQTIESIESIRKYNDQKIFLVECSNKNDDIDMRSVVDRVDVYIDLSKDDRFVSEINQPNKSWAELLMIGRCLEHLPSNLEEPVLKLSGRYALNENFKSINLNKDADLSCKMFTQHGPMRCCSVLYQMKNVSMYRDFYQFCIDALFQHRYNISMEEMLYVWCVNTYKSMHVIDSLGCQGRIAVTGNFETY